MIIKKQDNLAITQGMGIKLTRGKLCILKLRLVYYKD